MADKASIFESFTGTAPRFPDSDPERAGKYGRAGFVPPRGFEPVGGETREVGGPAGSGDVAADAGTIDPASLSSGPKRRGRPKWSDEERAARKAAREAKEADKLAVEPPDIPPTMTGQIAYGLSIVHSMWAMAANAPPLALSEEEAQTLAARIADVAKYYVKLTASNKGAAWFALLMTLAFTYVPRFAYLRSVRTPPQPMQPPPEPNAMDNMVMQ